jgi:hypothetical protein
LRCVAARCAAWQRVALRGSVLRCVAAWRAAFRLAELRHQSQCLLRTGAIDAKAAKPNLNAHEPTSSLTRLARGLTSHKLNGPIANGKNSAEAAPSGAAVAVTARTEPTTGLHRAKGASEYSPV